MSDSLDNEEIRSLTPDDYEQWAILVADKDVGAWPGFPVQQRHDFEAMTKETPVSVGAFLKGQLVGASLNFLKVDEQGELYLLVHMIGVRSDYRGAGTAKRLMQEIYRRLIEGRLHPSVEKVMLTSDSLESPNVHLYLHSCAMHVNHYIVNAYKDFNAKGGKQHRGVEADRFFYCSRPKSAWASLRELVDPSDYGRLAEHVPEVRLAYPAITPEAFLSRVSASVPPVVLVQIPSEVTARDLDAAHECRACHRDVFLGIPTDRDKPLELRVPGLFARGYTAVDHVQLSQPGYGCSIVLMRDFTEDDPTCLARAVSSMLTTRGA